MFTGPRYYQTLYDHLDWALERLFAAADGLTEEEYAAETAFTYRTVQAMLTHALVAEMRGDVRQLLECRVVHCFPFSSASS